jgi:hypothetical protein
MIKGLSKDRLYDRFEAAFADGWDGDFYALESTAEILNENEKTLSNYLYRGSFPLSYLRACFSDVEQLLEFVPEPWGLVAVTLPSGASRASVARSLELARRRSVPLAGVVENMAGYACPGCGERGELFPGDAGTELADRFDVPLLGRVPFDPRASRLADRGRVRELLRETEAGRALAELARKLEERRGPGGAGVDSLEGDP